jgi:hypothetical protein
MLTHRRRSDRGGAVGAAVRSAAVISVPPGQQERQFVVAAVGIQTASLCDAAGHRL